MKIDQVTTPSPAPPQARFFQWNLGFASLMLCRSLVQTGLIEQMADRPRTLDELADACQLHQDVLYRALRFATAIEVTVRQDGRYSLAALGRALLRDAPDSLYNALLIAGSEPWQRPWQNLAHCLRTGESAFEHVMGMPFFDYLEQHPEYGAPFHQQGSALSAITDPAIAAAYDFCPFRTVCDVGGGQGMFLRTLLQANPHLRGILFDLASVVQSHVLGELGERAEVVAGSFFERVPAADVLILKAVLHDWPDDKCAAILGQCRQVMQPDRRLLIVDRVMDEPVDPMNAFYDLHMQVQLRGRERTAAEFGALLQSASLQLRRIIPTTSPMIPLRIVEASLAGA